MKRTRFVLAVIVASALAGIARAQTSEIVGKVLDITGKPIAGAEVKAANVAFPERVYTDKSDKKGNYLVTGLLYAAQAQSWTISVKAEGYVPISVKTVARDAQRNLYLSDDVKLSAAHPTTELKIKGFSEVRMEFTLQPGDAAAEIAPIAPSGAAGVAGDAGVGSASTSYDQALAKVRSGDLEESVDLFKKALDEKPDDWERRDVFAKVLVKLDRQGEATIQANKAVQLAPDKAAPLVTLTDIYLARGLPDKAEESIGRAQKLEPDSTKVLERAASVAAGQGKLDEAITMSERILAAKPDNTEVLVSLAALYNRNKQPKKAEEALNRVVALDPANAHRTFYILGLVIENRDDLTEADHRKAIEAYRKAIDLKPDYAIAHRDLGLALLRTGDMMGARKELAKYVQIEPNAKDAADIKATVKSLESAK